MIRLISALLLATCAFAQPNNNLVHFDWDKLASKAAEKADVNLEGPMLEMASKFLSDKGEEAAVKKLVQGLKGIYVKTFEFDKDGQFSESDLGDIRTQLHGPGWSTMMEIKDRSESMGVYIRSNASKQTTGIAVLAVEPRELTFVQIDGPIDLSTLESLSGKLGIPKMSLAPVAPKSRRNPAPAPVKKKNND